MKNVLIGLPMVFVAAALAIAGGAQGTGTAGAGARAGDMPEGDFFPTVYASIAAYQADTGNRITTFSESPMIAQMGDLPPVRDRLPDEPVVIVPSQEIGSYGGALRDAHNNDLDFLEDMLREFPTMYAPDMQSVIPNIMQSWDIIDQGRVYVFHIRRGIKWSDGDAFDVKDFLFWYDAYANDTTMRPGGVGEIKVGGEHGLFEAVDDYTLRITFKERYGVFLDFWSRFRPLPYMPEHYLRDFHPAYASQADVDAKVRAAGFSAWNELFDEERKWPNNPQIPTIYAWKTTNKFSEAVQVLERNPYFWKIDSEGNQLPYIDRINRQNLGNNQETRLLNALAGETDYVHPNPLGFSANYATLIQNQERGNYRILRQYGWSNERGAMWFNFHHRDPVLRELFNDRDFRVALSIGTDRERMNDLTYNGTFVPSQPSPPSGPPYFGASGDFLTATEYDLDEANAMLDALGLQWNSGRTARMRSDGKPLQLVVTVRTRFPQVVQMAELLKEDWAKLGINVTLRPLADGGIMNEQMRAGNYDIQMHSVNMGGRIPILGGLRNPTVPINTSWTVSHQWGLWLNTGGAQGEEPPEDAKQLQRLQQQYVAEVDRDKRVELENQMYAIHNKNLWILGLLHQPHDHPQEWYVYFHNRLRNISQPNAPEWYYAQPSAWYIRQ